MTKAYSWPWGLSPTTGAGLDLGGGAWLCQLSVGWPLLRGLAWSLAALYLLMTFGVWLASLRTLGLLSLRRCPRVLRLTLRGSQVRELCIALLLPFLAAALAAALGLGEGFIGELPFAPFVLMASLCLTLFLVPPTVLVLSSSTDRQVRWALTLKKFTGGRRVVSLLDTGYMAVEPRVGDLWSVTLKRSATLTDVLRTSGAEGWEAGVEELIDLSPIVVVDARVCTRALLFEASAALAPRNAHKALFVSEDGGGCPLFEGLLAEGRVDPRTRVSVVGEGELGPLLAKLVASADALPKPGGFVSDPATIAEVVGRRGRVRQDPAPEPPRADHAAEAPGTGGLRRLSTTLTPFWRRMATGAACNFLLTIVLGPLVLSAPQMRTPPGLDAAILWALLVSNWVGCAAYFYLARSLTEVRIDGETLLVSDRSKQCEIHLSQVSGVDGPDWTTLRRVTIHLKGPSPFGQKIVFAGRLFRAGTDARELRRSLYSYAEQGARPS